MVARDGVERFSIQHYQQVADSMTDTEDTKDSKDRFCVRFVCGFSPRPTLIRATPLGEVQGQTGRNHLEPKTTQDVRRRNRSNPWGTKGALGQVACKPAEER